MADMTEREFDLVLTVELRGYGSAAQEDQLRKRIEEILRTRLHNDSVVVRKYIGVDVGSSVVPPGSLGGRVRARSLRRVTGLMRALL